MNNNLGKIDDGGLRIDYGEGKAIREPSTGKGRYDLITPFGLDRLAKWYELGAEKYEPRNWEKGMPFSRYTDSAFRHLNKFIMGMDDEDHLAAAVWNLLCIMHHQELGQLHFDDMPHYKTKMIENDRDKDIKNLHEMVDAMIERDGEPIPYPPCAYVMEEYGVNKCGGTKERDLCVGYDKCDRYHYQK